MITTDLSKFGYKELEELRDILNAWMDKGLPLSFNEDGIQPMFNMNSGYVFLTNSHDQVAMIGDNDLEIFHNCPECGQEGFIDDMIHSDNACCKEYLDSLK